MQDFQQRKKIRKTLYSRNIVILLAIVTILFVRGAIDVFQKMSESNVNAHIVENELILARQKNEELTKSMTFINTEAGVEREIRQKYSVIKQGEEVAVIIDPKIQISTSTVIHRGFWGSIGDWFNSFF